MIEDLLKLGRGFRIAVGGNESLAAHVSRVQTAKIEVIEVEAIRCQFIRKSDLQAAASCFCRFAPTRPAPVRIAREEQVRR